MFGNLTMNDYVSYSEFDTEESARDWRREIQGAVYLYHHSRATYLTDQDDDDRKGVQSEYRIMLDLFGSGSNSSSSKRPS